MNEIINNLKFQHLQKLEVPPKCVDIKFFEAMGVTVRVLKYYQVALEYPDLRNGRFMWYPTTGTLVHEGENKNRPYKKKFFDSEEVYEQLMKKVNV